MRPFVLLLAAALAAGPAPAASADGPPLAVSAAEPLDVLCNVQRLVPCETYYADADGDGYGDPATRRRAYSQPEGTVARGGDCDDTDPEVHPGAVERFNGRDDDCSGAADDVVLVLTEALVNPKAVSDANGEWIEVTNTSPKPVRLDGVSMAAGTRACALDGVLGAGVRLVAARSLDPSVNGGVHADVACGVQLPNAGGVIALSASTGALDVVDYRGWPVPDGASLSLDPGAEDPVANDDPSAWCAARTPLPSGDLGTPGAGNDPCGT